MSKNNNYDMITGFIMESRASTYRLAYSYVHNKEDALDIIQDSICKALSSVNSLDTPQYRKAWFYRIVINTALDFLRKKKRYITVDEDVLESIAPSLEDVYPDFDLQKELNKLSTTNKTIVMLRFYEDMKLDEIATIMNENVNTVKSRLYSSLKRLRIELENPS